MTNKKLLSSFLTITLALSSVTSLGVVVSEAKTSADFTDLNNLDEATKKKFDALIAAGIFDGVSDGTFGVKEEMNRAQFAKVAALIFNLKVDASTTTSSFSDVQSDSYALPYIEALKAAGITTGTTSTTFNPTGNVTKEQLAAFLVRGLGMENEAEKSQGTSDKTVSDWAKGYVALALEKKLLATDSGGNFGGRAPAIREQLVSGAFESKKLVEVIQPLKVSGAEFISGNKLELTLTAQIDLASIDLSKITINGVPLDSNLDSFDLSEDKKTIIIKLHNGFQLDSTKTPVIVVNGLKTLFGNELKNDNKVPIPVKITEPPYNPKPEPPVEQPNNPEPEAPVEQPNEPKPEEPVEQPNKPKPEEPVEQPNEPKPEEPVEQPNEPKPEEPVEQPSNPNPEEPIEQPNNPKPEEPVEQPNEPNLD